VNVAEVAPFVTVTVAGGAALALVEESLTTVPSGGAGPLKVTVPVDETPPTTDVGKSVKPVNTAGVIVSDPVLDVVPTVAVILAIVTSGMPEVMIVKDADVAPAATVTLGGSTTKGVEVSDAKATTVPPVGAGPFSVTVPVEDVPPRTEVGFTVRPAGTGAVTLSVAIAELPPSVAVTVAAKVELTEDVEIVKVAVVDPAATVTVAGQTTPALPEAKLTIVPPVGAGPSNVTVPVDCDPPTTEVGDIAKLAKVPGAVILRLVVAEVLF